MSGSGGSKVPTQKTDDTTLFRHMHVTDQSAEQFFARKDLAKRPGYNATGKEITVAVNSYPITQFPTKSVYQYDVSYSYT